MFILAARAAPSRRPCSRSPARHSRPLVVSKTRKRDICVKFATPTRSLSPCGWAAGQARALAPVVGNHRFTARAQWGREARTHREHAQRRLHGLRRSFANICPSPVFAVAGKLMENLAISAHASFMDALRSVCDADLCQNGFAGTCWPRVKARQAPPCSRYPCGLRNGRHTHTRGYP